MFRICDTLSPKRNDSSSCFICIDRRRQYYKTLYLAIIGQRYSSIAPILFRKQISPLIFSQHTVVTALLRILLRSSLIVILIKLCFTIEQGCPVIIRNQLIGMRTTISLIIRICRLVGAKEIVSFTSGNCNTGLTPTKQINISRKGDTLVNIGRLGIGRTQIAVLCRSQLPVSFVSLRTDELKVTGSEIN